MSDAGEALVDAEARLQERLEEREAERSRRGFGTTVADPERQREIESLKLARKALEDQAASTGSPVLRKQLDLALAEIARRLESYM